MAYYWKALCVAASFLVFGFIGEAVHTLQAITTFTNAGCLQMPAHTFSIALLEKLCMAEWAVYAGGHDMRQLWATFSDRQT